MGELTLDGRRLLLKGAMSLLPLVALPGGAMGQNAGGAAAPLPADLPKSKAEASNFEETSRYDDVMKFFRALEAKSPLIRVQFFGKTFEGRDMPLITLASKPVTTPAEATALGKPVVFVFANIHAGEVEGKEAVQHFTRRVLFGDLKPLLDKLTILIAPNYNADGNEKIAVNSRIQQNGPINGVGVRTNSQGFDLNRDYIKLESPEARALVKLLQDWDPLMSVDLHTTNGSYHGYHLTYSIPLNPMVDTPIYKYHREVMMPAIAKTMLDHKWRTYYYGNFSQGQNPRSGAFGASATRAASTGPAPGVASAPAAGGGGAGGQPMRYMAFIHQPRIGQNYIGFRNRFTILSEAYSYISFKDRIAVTEDFVIDICNFTAANAEVMMKMAKDADAAAIKRGEAGGFPIGVTFEQQPLPNPVDIIVSDTVEVMNPKNNRAMRNMDESKNRTVRMLDYGIFGTTRTVPAARAYLFKNDALAPALVAKLHQHGVVVETLSAPVEAEVDTFAITSVTKERTLFQNHAEVSLGGSFKKEKVSFPAGTYVVKTAQPLGMLAAYIMEPESDDGFTKWNFLDAALGEGKSHPVSKVMGDVKLETKKVDPPK